MEEMRILVLPCDGIGPEITDAAMNVLLAANDLFGLGLEFDFDDVGFKSLEKFGTTLRDEVLERAKTYDGIILGPQSNANYPPQEQGGRIKSKVGATYLRDFGLDWIFTQMLGRHVPDLFSKPI
jgi:isocitrate/isopropylmalate dehydrogenase